MKRTVIFAILSLVLAASVIGGMGASMQKTCNAYEAYYEEVHDENIMYPQKSFPYPTPHRVSVSVLHELDA